MKKRKDPPPAELPAEPPPLPVQPGLYSEDNIRKALELGRGDIFRAASLMQVKPSELDSAIRFSESLQAYTMAIDRVKADPEYDGMSTKAFVEETRRLAATMALDGLLSIHELATGSADSAAEKDVKLRAAIELRKASPHHHGGGELGALLAQLNEQYQEHAPRIREIRTTTVVLQDSRRNESSPQAIDLSARD